MYVAVVVALLALISSISGLGPDPIDRRLLMAYTPAGTVISMFPCTEPGDPLDDPAGPVDRICFVQCLDTRCDIYESGTFDVTSPDGARNMDFLVSSKSEAAFLYTNPAGLHLTLCATLSCADVRQRTLRIGNETIPAVTLGNSLALTPNASWVAGFVERTGPNDYQAVLLHCSSDLCRNWTQTIVSNWSSTTEREYSPCFVKIDSLGRYIMGFQAFSGTNQWFELWRCSPTRQCELMRNYTLENGLTSISLARYHSSPNYGIVMLTGADVFMMHYISGLTGAVYPDPPSITRDTAAQTDEYASPDLPPEISIPSTPFLPPSPEPDGLPTEEPIAYPIEPTTAPLEAIEPEIIPEAQIPPVISSPTASNTSYWYASDLHVVVTSTANTGGFQAHLEYLSGTPIFALGYYQASGTYDTARGYCGTTSCRTNVAVKSMVSTATTGSTGLPQVGVAILPGTQRYVLILTHQTTGKIRRLVLASYTANSEVLEDDELTFGASKGPTRRGNWDVLGIVGIANAAIATVVVLLSLTVFAIHFSVNRRVQDDNPANWDSTRLSPKQRQILSLYYSTLKAD